MKKSDLINKIAEANPHLQLKDVEKIVSVILGTITKSLANGDRVEFRDFGTFSVKKRDARTAKNPRTGELVKVEEKFVPHFKCGKGLFDLLNS